MKNEPISNSSITGAEMLYHFLTVARDELIYSVDIDDIIYKMSVIEQQPEFASIRAAFNPIPQGNKPWFLSAMQSLVDSNKVAVYQNELMLAKNGEQMKEELPQETKLMYLHMAQLYRTIDISKQKTKSF